MVKTSSEAGNTNNDNIMYKNKNMKSENGRENPDLPPNLYSLLFMPSDQPDKPMPNILDSDDEDDLLSDKPNSDDNFFILDRKLKEERQKRLNEKDKMYKIKKHYYLKDSYNKIAQNELMNIEFENLKERTYLDNCYRAEEKLMYGEKLNHQDVYYLLRRNYQLLTPNEKNDIHLLQRLFNGFYLSAGVGTFLMTTFLRSVQVYFKKNAKSSILSYSILGLYSIGFYFSLRHFINLSYEKKMSKYCLKAKDRILNPENEYLKTPYDVNEKKFKPDPEEEQYTKVFKF